MKILLIEVWLSLPHPVSGDLRGRDVSACKCGFLRLRACVKDRREDEVEKWGGGGGEDSVVFPLSACVWRWR